MHYRKVKLISNMKNFLKIIFILGLSFSYLQVSASENFFEKQLNEKFQKNFSENSVVTQTSNENNIENEEHENRIASSELTLSIAENKLSGKINS